MVYLLGSFNASFKKNLIPEMISLFGHFAIHGHKMPYKATKIIQGHKRPQKATKDHKRPYKATKGHTRPQKVNIIDKHRASL